MWEDNKWWTFSLEEVLLWTGILIRSDGLIKRHGFVSYKHTAFQFIESCGLLWCFHQRFNLSFWWLWFLHSLQRIHWCAIDVMLNFSKSAPMKKQTHLHLGWPEEEFILSKFPFLGELFLWIDCHVRNLPPTVHHYSHQVVQSIRVGSITRGVKEPQLEREDYTIRELGVAMKLVHILKAL